MEILEVDVEEPAPMEPVVTLARSVEVNQGEDVNVVVGGRLKNNLLHVKARLGANQGGVDLLVHTGSTCNLVSTAMCKRLWVVLSPQ